MIQFNGQNVPRVSHWRRVWSGLLAGLFAGEMVACEGDFGTTEQAREEAWLEQETRALAENPADDTSLTAQASYALDPIVQTFLNGLPERVGTIATSRLVREPSAQSLGVLNQAFQNAFRSQAAGGAFGPRVRADTAVVGSLSGTLSIDEAGNGAYILPLTTSPGRPGLEPNLSLRYSSAESEGTVGMGWSLALPPVIAPCDPWGSKVLEDNNGFVTDKVSVGEAKQRMCYGGLPLVHEQGGESDATQASGFYFTVPDTGVRIKRAFLGAPANAFADGDLIDYEVQSADGLRQTYVHMGKSWYLRRKSDPFGNRIDFKYGSECGDDSHIPEINWSGPEVPGAPYPCEMSYHNGSRKVRFAYDAHPRPRVVRTPTGNVIVDRLLRKITMVVDGEAAWHYDLNFNRGELS